MKGRLSKETLFLGLMMLSPEVFREYVSKEYFAPAGFEEVVQQELCRIIKSRAGRSKAPTRNSVMAAVEDGDLRAEMWTMLDAQEKALQALDGKVSPAEVEEAAEYFQPVAIRAERNIAIEVFEMLKEKILKAGSDSGKLRSAQADAIKRLTQMQMAAAPAKRDRRPVKLSDGLEATFEDLSEAMRRTDEAVFFPTGLTELDDMFNGGLRPGELIYGMGRPGSGKSVFGQRAAIGTALRGVPTAFLSGEMTLQGCFLRVLSCLSDILPSPKGLRPVPLKLLRNPKLLQGQSKVFERLEEVLDQIGDLPLYYVDVNGIEVSELWAVVGDLVNTYGVKVIVGDYAQLMRVKGSGDMSDVKVMDTISENLREMTLAFNLASLWLAQASRGVENRPDKRLNMSDIRGSGKFEADAHAVVSFYRDEYYFKEESTEPNTMEVTAHKMRDGELKTVKLYFGGAYAATDNYRPDAVVSRKLAS